MSDHSAQCSDGVEGWKEGGKEDRGGGRVAPPPLIWSGDIFLRSSSGLKEQRRGSEGPGRGSWGGGGGGAAGRRGEGDTNERRQQRLPTWTPAPPGDTARFAAGSIKALDRVVSLQDSRDDFSSRLCSITELHHSTLEKWTNHGGTLFALDTQLSNYKSYGLENKMIHLYWKYAK